MLIELMKPDTDLRYLIQQTMKWNKIAAGGEFDLSTQRKILQHKCLLEEVKELKEAIQEEDEVEVVDAICDILFVAAYSAYMLNGSGILNMNDLGHNSLDLGYTVNDLLEQLTALCDHNQYWTMVLLIRRVSVLFNFNLKAAYEEVVMSNFTKFPLVDDVDIQSELKWFKEESKYNNVVHTVVDGHYVFRCDNGNGKIVKPRGFTEPTLKDHIGRSHAKRDN